MAVIRPYFDHLYTINLLKSIDYRGPTPQPYHANIAGLQVHLTSWDEEALHDVVRKAYIDGVPFIVYTYPKSAITMKKHAAEEAKKHDDVEVFGSFQWNPVSRYQLRRLFVRQGVRYGTSLEELLLKASPNEIHVYSDTPVQARYLVERWTSKDKTKEVKIRHVHNVSSFENNKLSHDCTELVICSAPMAHFLSRLSNLKCGDQWVEIPAPDHELKDSDARNMFDLVSLFWFPQGTDGLIIKQIQTTIENYHSEFLKRLRKAELVDIKPILESYQLVIRSRSLIIPIEKPEEFQEVLFKHHSDPLSA